MLVDRKEKRKGEKEGEKEKTFLKILSAFSLGFLLGLLFSLCPKEEKGDKIGHKETEYKKAETEELEKRKEEEEKEKKEEKMERVIREKEKVAIIPQPTPEEVERAFEKIISKEKERRIPEKITTYIQIPEIKEDKCDNIDFYPQLIEKPPKLWNRKSADIVFSTGITTLICFLNQKRYECENVTKTKLFFEEDGEKIFSVVFKAGKCEKKILEYSFIVDTNPPETKIIPLGFDNVSLSPNADFRFETSEPVRIILCRLDDGEWMDCSTGKIQLTNIEDGEHIISVYSIDFAGNVEEVKKFYKFEVDASEPITIIQEKPQSVVRKLPVTIKFKSNKKNARFECSIDEGAWLPCFSPMKIEEAPPGLHTIKIRTIDKRGRVEKEPVIIQFIFERD